MQSSGTLVGSAPPGGRWTMAPNRRATLWWALGLGLLAAGATGAVAFYGQNRPAEDRPAAAAPAGPGAAGREPAESGATRPEAAAPSASSGGSERAVAVSAVPLTVRQVQRSVNAVGSFFGFDEVTVPAEVSGIVSKIYHDVGDVVRPGDVLMEIDPTDHQLAVDETRRMLELEATRLGVQEEDIQKAAQFQPEQILEIVSDRVDIQTLPSVVRAKEQLANASSRQDRARQLRERGSMSSEEVDQRQTDFEVAKAAYDQAMLDARAALAGIKYRLVLLRIVNRKLALTKIKVPSPTSRLRMPQEIRYAVVERKVTEGEMLKDAPGSSSATYALVMDGVLKLKATVPERYAGQVQEGQEADIFVDAYPDRKFQGQVIRINPMIDRTSRTFQVEVFVDNPKRELKAGGFAKVDILTHVDPNAWTVPAEAIVSYAGSIKIFVIRAGRAHVVSVVPGIEGRDWVELVRSQSPDLRQDDRVITSGQEKLAEGVAVFDRQQSNSGSTASGPRP
jgi:multidrug efflux pump subunit AcrA (membrane-fusion protein)